MRTDPGDPHTLTGAYVLDALDTDERAGFEAHLAGCELCAREVDALQVVTARLAEFSAEEPPTGLRDRILAAAAATPQERSVGTSGPGSGRAADVRQLRAERWTSRLAVAASVILVVAVAGLSFAVATLTGRVAELDSATREAEDTTRQLTELLAAPDVSIATVGGDDGAMGRVVASAARGEAVFVVDGMSAPPDGCTYQLWLIDDQQVTPAGLFEPDSDGRASELLTGDIRGASVVGVTVEPLGGSPQPTTEPVLAVPIG
jgi:anti-sigma-K factor RskA